MLITDKLQAHYCSKYAEKRTIVEGTVHCSDCSQMNKYGYCQKKKKCIDKEDWSKDRKCISFKKRGSSSAPKKKKSRTATKKNTQSSPKKEPTFPWERP